MNITIKNIKKKYYDKTVLDINNFHFSSGGVYGIIGPNGAGKSTMLKIIGRMEKESSGNVIYNDSCINKDILMNMTYVTQKPYLFNTTVFNNISYPLKFRKYSKEQIQNAVQKIINEFEINDLSQQSATSLSGGEAQRVSLARALIFKPSILLLDEPTASMDPNSIELIEKIILNYSKENNATILFITHNVPQARRVCDQVIYLDNGTIVENGKTEEVILSPKTKRVKRFLSLEYYID